MNLIRFYSLSLGHGEDYDDGIALGVITDKLGRVRGDGSARDGTAVVLRGKLLGQVLRGSITFRVVNGGLGRYENLTAEVANLRDLEVLGLQALCFISGEVGAAGVVVDVDRNVGLLAVGCGSTLSGVTVSGILTLSVSAFGSGILIGIGVTAGRIRVCAGVLIGVTAGSSAILVAVAGLVCLIFAFGAALSGAGYGSVSVTAALGHVGGVVRGHGVQGPHAQHDGHGDEHHGEATDGQLSGGRSSSAGAGTSGGRLSSRCRSRCGNWVASASIGVNPGGRSRVDRVSLGCWDSRRIGVGCGGVGGIGGVVRAVSGRSRVFRIHISHTGNSSIYTVLARALSRAARRGRQHGLVARSGIGTGSAADVLAGVAKPAKPCNKERVGGVGSGGVEKHIKALVITHRGDVQLRPDGFLLSADIARSVGLELQNGGV